MMSSRPMMMTYASPPYMPVTMTTTTTTTAAAGNTPNATAQLLQPLPPAGQPSMMQSPSLPAWSAQPTCMWPGQQQQKQQQQQVMNACSPGPMPMMTMVNISTSNNNNNTNNNGNSVPMMVLTPSPANINLAATTNTANTSYAPVSNTSSNSTIHNVGAMSPASPMTMSMTGVEKGNTSAATTTTMTMMMQNNNTSPYAPRMTCAETPYILTSLPAPVAEANNNTNNTNNSTNAAMTMNGAVSAFAPSQQQQQQQQPMPASMTTSPYNMPGGYTITTTATIPAQASNNNTNNGSYMMSNTAATAAAAGTTGGLCMMSAEGANGPTTTAAAAIPTGAAPTMTAAQIPAAATMMMMPVPTTQPTYAPLVTEAAAAPTAAAAAPTPNGAAAVVQPQMMATFVQPTVLLPSTAFDGAVFLQPLPTAQPLSLIAPPPPPPLPQLALPVMREEHQWNGTQYELNGLYEGYVKRYNPVRGFGFLTATHRLLPKTVLHIPHLSQDANENSSNNNNSTTSNSNSTGVASSSMTSSVLSAPACHAMMGEGLQPHDAMTNQPNELQQQQQQQSMYAASLSCESMLSGSSTNAQGNMQLSSVHFHRIPVILGDIFVHQSYLMMRGFRSLPLSGRVRFRVGPMPGRCTLQAVEVELLPQVVPADVKRSLMLQHMHVLLQQQQATGTTATATTMESNNHGGQMSLPGITTAAAAMNAGHAARCGTDEDELCTTQTTTSTTNGTDSQPLVTASLTGLSVAAEHSPRGTLTLPFSERQLLDSGFYDPILDENDPLTTENFVFTMDDMVLGESATQPPEEEGMQHREGNKHGGSSFSVSLLDFDNQEEKEGVRGETRAHEATASHKSRYTAYQQVVHH